jgi:tRNA nucleotidyltransferase/poly(A) polymerase
VKFPDRLQIPEVILEIARRLESAGFETWCVGGAVRDNLLELPNKDFDLATAARPEQVRELFHHTIPVGMSHGTVAVLDRGRHLHEVTTFRRDVRTDGRHAEVASSGRPWRKTWRAVTSPSTPSRTIRCAMNGATRSTAAGISTGS